jgi:hypothetical protein
VLERQEALLVDRVGHAFDSQANTLNAQKTTVSCPDATAAPAAPATTKATIARSGSSRE